jgi:NDP-sugar pyrophosphorylase family protein
MKHIDNITALILAGGLGTRLSSVVSDRPKVLASVNGQPFLSYLLDQLVSAGFREVILCTGYKGEMIRETFGDSYRDLTIRYSREPKPLGTGGALRYALPMIEEETVLVMNGDSYVDADLSAYLKWYFKNETEAALLLTKVADASRYGKVEVDIKNCVISFEEKKEDADAGYINAGVYILKKHLLERIPSARPFSLEREFFPSLIGKGLFGYLCETELLDIGTPESYAKAERFFSGLCK